MSSASSFVINRVTADTMEPRGCVGDYDAADDQLHALHHAAARLQPYRSNIADLINVPESRVHVIAGDIGGSFGMKSAIYNEMPLMLLASRLIGRPVKWTSTRSEALSERRARPRQRDRGVARARPGTASSSACG